ncbi:(+)-neomenthol dehydrogenase [Quillaja saponaria]|uniref:(+)-neomenthol dehydrogenase n=1 Tax=Quillaja saponaria TaxID=32244 RepID=A0AAD7LQ90_QUISA|nr:(+)-neomenthol dehydrogenase [Quillaja saponaria]
MALATERTKLEVSSVITDMEKEAKRFAVVTGANKGIGFGICKQLASNGVIVVLTARDERKGLEAVQKMKEFGLSDHVIFHQLDVANPASIASLEHFIQTQFGKLDILVNNAGIPGAVVDGDALAAAIGKTHEGVQVDWTAIGLTQTYELAEEGVKTNYYGAKRMTQAFINLLQLSDSPRIVYVSASIGKLQHIPNEWAKGVLSDIESLTEEKLDEVLNEYLKDFSEGSLDTKGWPDYMSAYIISKAASNAYTRMVATKYPSFCINCVCPGYVKTDINYNTGFLSIEEGAASPVRLVLLPNGGPSGFFFNRNELSTF